MYINHNFYKSRKDETHDCKAYEECKLNNHIPSLDFCKEVLPDTNIILLYLNVRNKLKKYISHKLHCANVPTLLGKL